MLETLGKEKNLEQPFQFVWISEYHRFRRYSDTVMTEIPLHKEFNTEMKVILSKKC